MITTQPAVNTGAARPSRPLPSSKPNFLLTVALLCLSLLSALTARAVPLSSPPRVLILDETVYGGATSQEAAAAILAIPGCAVDICTAANWTAIPATGTGGPTGYGFDSYRAIIIGDPLCGTSSTGYLAALTALNASKTTWTPVCTGNVIIEGVDNALHAYSLIGADKTLKRGIAFAVNDPTKTGFYYAMSCYYDYTAPAVTPTLVPHLTVFGTFMTRNYNYVCFNDAHIVATHPVFTAAPPLTDAELSGWSCSTHEGFDQWPANFIVLAIALTNGTYTATDGSNGIPYILVRGEGVKVVGTIELGPPIATNIVGTTHTVCATLATNVFPKLGVPITFTILTGPNAVTNYTSLSDSNGVACFTYAGVGGVGTDIIIASYLNHDDITNHSGPVTKIWKDACVGVGCENLVCSGNGSWTYSFCVTNTSPAPMTYLSLLNPPAGISFAPNIITFTPPLAIGQSTNVTVTVNSTGLNNFCFNLAAQQVEGVIKCSVAHCVTLPACCNRIVTNTLTYVSTVGAVATYNYQVTIQNVSTDPLKYVAFAADQACVTFIPPMLDLSLPVNGGPGLVLPGQFRTLNLQVKKTAPCAGTNYFTMSTLNSNLVACCSVKYPLPPYKCVGLSSPYDGSVVLTNTTMAIRAVAIGPCGWIIIKFYRDDILIGLRDLPPYEVNDTPQLAGTYSYTAVATLDNGDLETSDPVRVTVLAPNPNPDQNSAGGPIALTVGVTSKTVLLGVPTDFVHHYALEYRTNLASGTWQTLQTVAGDGTVKMLTDNVSNDLSRFYRAVQLP